MEIVRRIAHPHVLPIAADPAAGRELQALLDARDATERQRSDLAAQLCDLLARLRLASLATLRLESDGDGAGTALQAASAEVEALLAAKPAT